jgi:succinylarginine dihydrolase
MPSQFWPRQSLESCRTIARIHRLPPQNTFFLKQHPAAIEAGAFHNDVVAASHHGLLIHHELAFYNARESLRAIAGRYREIYGRELTTIVVKNDKLPLPRAIATYLFNSQLSSPRDSHPPLMICPAQVREDRDASALVAHWQGRGLIGEYRFAELRQSMAAGGGPACLRLRVPLTAQQLRRAATRCRWSEQLDSTLRELVRKNYPDRVSLADLADIDFVRQAQRAGEKIRAALS